MMIDTHIYYYSLTIYSPSLLLSIRLPTTPLNIIIFSNITLGGVLKKTICVVKKIIRTPYLLLVYLVTAFVPSDTACFANSPGSSSRTAVWISRLVIVDRLL